MHPPGVSPFLQFARRAANGGDNALVALAALMALAAGSFIVSNWSGTRCRSNPTTRTSIPPNGRGGRKTAQQPERSATSRHPWAQPCASGQHDATTRPDPTRQITLPVGGGIPQLTTYHCDLSCANGDYGRAARAPVPPCSPALGCGGPVLPRLATAAFSSAYFRF